MKIVERKAVRAILISPQKEILLMRIKNPVTQAEFWICPGGGINENEDLDSALARELKEELGLEEFQANHKVHLRHHIYQWKESKISQFETFFIVHVDKFHPVISDPIEAQHLLEFKWWNLAELESEKHPITPKSLRKIVESYLKDGPPKGELVLESVQE